MLPLVSQRRALLCPSTGFYTGLVLYRSPACRICSLQRCRQQYRNALLENLGGEAVMSSPGPRVPSELVALRLESEGSQYSYPHMLVEPVRELARRE